MRMQKKMSKCQSVSPQRVARGDKVSKGIQKLIFLFFFLIFHFSLSHAESLSDIKLDALDKPIKEKWGSNPFIRYEDRTAKLKDKTFRGDAPADLKLSGIISDGKKAMAIINGGFYRKNERVNNFLIVDIAKDRVTLEKNGKRFYLGVEKFAVETHRDKDMNDKWMIIKEKEKKDDKEAKK